MTQHPEPESTHLRLAEFEPPVRVAIADDDPLARMAVEAIIEPAGSLEFVGAAAGVDQIVELVARKRPQVVLLDWMMPSGGGPEAARRILARNADTRIVGLTSSDSPQAWLEMMRAGARGFLIKGGSRAELARTIHQALDA